MATGAEQFVARLASTDDQVAALLREHLEDNEGELLLHLFVARVRDLAIHYFEHRDLDESARIVDVFEEGLVNGDRRCGMP